MIKKKFLENIVNPFIKKLLHKYAKYYSLEKNYDQLVVYSYDSVSTEINLNGIYEKDFLFFFKKFLSEKKYNIQNKAALDIGAFIGNHSIFFSKIFSEVLSFEPHPISYEILKINCRNFKNIKMFNFACSDENKDSYLRLKHTNIGGSSISEGNHIRDHSIKLFKLDDFLKDNIIEIGLIKIDVEGHEENVINGCIELLKKNKPIIIMELKNFHKESEPNVVKKLKSLGYSKFFEVERSLIFNANKNSLFLSILDRLINLFYKNPIQMKEIKFFKKKEYQNIIII